MPKEFKCEGPCGRTFMGSDENISEVLDAQRLWGNVPAQEMAVLCPDCDRAFRKWYAKNFGIVGGKK